MHLRALKYMQGLERLFGSKDSSERSLSPAADSRELNRGSYSVPSKRLLPRKSRSEKDDAKSGGGDLHGKPVSQNQQIRPRRTFSIDASSKMSAIPVAGSAISDSGDLGDFLHHKAVNTEAAFVECEREQFKVHLNRVKSGMEHLHAFLDQSVNDKSIARALEMARAEVALLRSENLKLRQRLAHYENSVSAALNKSENCVDERF